MTNQEAVAVNGLIYTYLRMRHLLAMVSGAPVPGSKDDITMLADRAHKAIGMGIDGELVKKAWSDPAALDDYSTSLKRKAQS